MPATKELLQEGRYRINQAFSPNGSSTIYDAYDTVSNSNVVVKEFAATTENKSAFENQAKVLTAMQHDSLLNIKDFFADLESHYLVMEAVEGDDLQELMRRNKSPFGLEDVLKWADELLDALNYLHSHRPSVIHKNVKPENIKLASNGQIKLLAVSGPDANSKLSTSLGPDASSEEALRYAPIEMIWQGLDPASQMAITNGYDERSERILKEPADPRTDIYSLGATLYHLVTATEPVNALERSIEVLDGKPDPLKEATKLNPSVPPEISDVLLKAMELKRENRYDSAAFMRQILSSVAARYQEGKAAEAKEQLAAQEAIRQAEQLRAEQEAAEKRAAEEAESKRLAAEAEAKRVAEENQRKRVEAEKQAKADAEKNAADAAAALRKEQEEAAAKKAAEEKVARDAKEAQAKAAREASEKAAKETQAKAEANEKAAKAAAATAVSSEVVAYGAEAATANETSFASSYDDTDEPKSGFGMMPIIGAGVSLVILIAVAFFVLSGNNDSKTPSTVIGGSSTQIAPASSLETAPDPSQVPVQPEQAAAPAPEPDTQTQARAGADREKAKKAAATTPAAAKPAETKKSVTVDDLINDN